MDVEYGYCHCGCGAKAPIATATRASRGWVKGEPIRFIRGHSSRKVTPTIDGIVANCEVNTSTGCYEWAGSRTASGYGVITAVNAVKSGYVHRLMWELNFGKIDGGLHVLHKCDNPSCCNVKHLFLGTQRENMADKVAKGRQPKGDQCGCSKLTSEQVSYIRSTTKTGVELCAELGMSSAQISRIRTNKRWVTPQEA